MMRNPLARRWAAAVLLCAAWSGAQARDQEPVRGIHEPASVTVVAPAPPAPAQPDAAPTPAEPVTVEARLTRPEMEKQSLRFVQTYATPTAKLNQFARWREPLCIQVTTVDPFEAAGVSARITEVAKTLGLKVRQAGCEANIEIVFANQPQHWLNWVATHQDSILGYHYVWDTRVLEAVGRPAQAWYQTATRSDGGGDAGPAFGLAGVRGFVGVSPGNETLDNPEGPTPAGCGDSRLSSCLQSVLRNVLVFVDTGKLKSREIGPLSDYLAMLTLSQPRSLDGCAPFASVIDLLSPNCAARAPDALTAADKAYLKALYTANLEGGRASEESDIAGRMTGALIKAMNSSPAARGDRGPSATSDKSAAPR